MYNVALTRYVEHETFYKVEADSEGEAVKSVLSGNYIEIIDDTELGELDDPQVIEVEDI